MNAKFGLVVGAAIACAMMTGCKATKVKSGKGTPVEPVRPAQQTEVVVVDEKPAAQEVKPAVTVQPAPEVKRCKCAPGTMHDSPCACGASDCKCKVKAPEPEYTIYKVKSGDMLSSICATYGLKQSKVLALNPGMEANKLYAGKKIKLPGKVELKDADAAAVAAPAKPTSAPAAAKRTAATAKPTVSSKATSYTGATKEYVVQSGDTLGKIAYSNGITIKCLKDMNGLKKNNIRVGQKLKIPAEKPVVEAKPAAEKNSEQAAAAAKPVAAKPDVAAEPAAKQDVKEVNAPDPNAKSAEENAAMPSVEQVKETTAALESVSSPTTHTVKDGEDIVAIAIQYDVSPSAILDLNNLKNTDEIPPGTVLKLPAKAKVQ